MNNVFKFDFSNLRGDFFGGLTAGIVALPLALAFGAQTALGPMAGLYGAIAIAILAALFGGTATQVSGPTAPMTVVSSAVIANAILESGANSVEEALPLILVTFFLAGLIEMLFGVIKLGKYIKYIPYPVVSGFMSGIGVIIIITQLFPLLGYNPTADQDLVASQLVHAEEQILEKIIREEEQNGTLKGVMDGAVITATEAAFAQVTSADIQQEAQQLAKQKASGTVGTLRHILRPFVSNGINWTNFLLALATIVIIYGFKRITTLIPSSLVALIVLTLVAFFFIAPGGVPVIGEVREGFPPLHFDFFGALFSGGSTMMVIKFAFTLAALGAIDSLLTSVVADNITKTRHNPDQELIGQGIGNMAAAFVAGLPGAGATMRTVINVQSGGKTKISGVIAGVFLLAVLLGLGSIVQYIPNGVLAGILLTVGVGIIDYKGFRHLKAVPRGDAVVMILVLLLTVFVGLLEAVALGMVLAALLFMKKSADTVAEGAGTESLREFAQEKPWEDEGDLIERVGSKVYIKHLDGPLFFGFVSSFQTIIQNLPELEVLIIRLGRVPYIDQSGLYAMEDAILDLQNRGIAVVFTGMNSQVRSMMERINLVPGLVDDQYVFPDFKSCRKWLGDRLERGDLEHVPERQASAAPKIGDNVDEM